MHGPQTRDGAERRRATWTTGQAGSTHERLAGTNRAAIKRLTGRGEDGRRELRDVGRRARPGWAGPASAVSNAAPNPDAAELWVARWLARQMGRASADAAQSASWSEPRGEYALEAAARGGGVPGCRGSAGSSWRPAAMGPAPPRASGLAGRGWTCGRVVALSVGVSAAGVKFAPSAGTLLRSRRGALKRPREPDP